MSNPRTLLVGLTTAALLSVPGAALAAAPTAGSASVHPAQKQATHIRWLSFAHIHAAGSRLTLVGQVTATSHGQLGALAGAHVKIYRQLDGSSRWLYLGTRATSSGAVPEFRFTTIARQNAHYRAAYGGSVRFGASSGITWLKVHRLFHGKLTDGANAATYRGNVTPYYTHKPITLQRRSCATCSYVRYRVATTGLNGAFMFKLPAPPSGRWWWRVSTPATVAFIASYSGTISTQRV